MRKISVDQENPIDDLLIDLSEKTFPFFKKIGFTPNGLTTLSLLFGLISIYGLYYGKIGLFVITFIISYFFDVADGGYARKYKMTSEFGCYYDHFKDVFVNVFIIGILLYRHWSNKKVVVMIILYLLIFGSLMIINLGCQENIYDKDDSKKESPGLYSNRKLCSKNPENTIKYTRFFGCGTYILLFTLLVVFVELKK